MKTKNIYVILWFILIIFFTILLAKFFLQSGNISPIIEESSLNVTVNGSNMEILNAKDIYTVTESRSFKKGDNVIVSFVLPTDNYEFPTLLLSTQFVGYTVSIDDTIIYQKRIDKALDGDFLPRDICLITIPYSAYKGKELVLNMTVSQSDIKTIMNTPFFGNFDDLVRNYTRTKAVSVFLGTFMCMFGVIFLLISLFFAAKINGLSGQVRSSILCVCGGAWILTSQRLNLVFMTNNEIPAFYEYLSLYASLPIIMLLYCTICHRLHKKASVTSIIAVSLIELSFVICHLTRIRYLNMFSRPFAIMYIICLIGYMTSSFYYLRRRKASTYDKVQIAGLNTLISSLIIASVLSILDKNGARIFNNAISIIMGIGGIMFVASRIMTLMVSLHNADPMKKREMALSSLAYIDSLTGLPNRTSCDQETMKLDDNNLDYLIMSLDLNGLKEVNDSRGHSAGDELLRNFADVLNICFPDPCFKGRTGGDEFIVLLNEIPNEGYIESHIAHMNKLLEDKGKDTGFDHSVAYGYCYRHEMPQEAHSHEVYMKADERMYALKRKQHEQKKMLKESVQL